MGAVRQPVVPEAHEQRRRHFREITDLAEAMLEKARTAEWSAVAEMEARRQALIGTFFETAPHPDEKNWLADAIRTVLDIDQTIVRLGREGLAELGAELKTVKTGQQATRAYGVVGG